MQTHTHIHTHHTHTHTHTGITHTHTPTHTTWDSCGLFQLTGTRPLEFEPDEVEEVLLVTAMTCGLPFRPTAVRWSPYLCPMMGVCGRRALGSVGRFKQTNHFRFDCLIHLFLFHLKKKNRTLTRIGFASTVHNFEGLFMILQRFLAKPVI